MNRSLENSGPFSLRHYCPRITNLIIHVALVATAVLISIHLVTPDTHIAILWLANGITLGVLLTNPRRYWMAYLLCSLSTNIVIGLINGTTPLRTVIISAGNIVEILVAASFIYRPDRPAHHFTDRASALRMLAGFIVGPAASMIIAAAARYWITGTPWLQTVQVWYLAHCMGLAIVTPLTLTVLFKDFEPLMNRRALPRTIFCLALLVVAMQVVFMQTQLPLLFLVFPFVALIAFQLGFAGMTASLFILGIGVSFFTLLGSGPFMLIQETIPGERVLFAQFFICSCIAMALPIAIALIERHRLELSLLVAQDQLRALAATDQLTAIPNRRMFDEFIDREWKRAGRDKSAICAIMIDVDCFKLYNDRYGHQAGDECLKAVATCLVEVVRRPGDLIARYGGEEFIALLPNTKLDGARFVAEQIRRRVEALQIVHTATSDGRVTVSIGVAMGLPEDGGASEGLIAVADANLYMAKENGRNCVCDGDVTPLKKRASG